MPEDPTPPSNSPRRHRPRLNELASETTEEDLWDLDDEEISDFATPAPPPEEPAVEELEDPGEPEPVPESVEAEEEVEEEPAPEPEAVDEPAAPAAEQPAPVEPSPQTQPAAPSVPIAKPNGKEKIGLGILGVVFIALGIWWLLGLLSDVPTTRMGQDEPDFPIEGGFTEATAAESYWRAPIREGDQRDIARTDVIIIPILKVTITGTGDGVLRAIYRDDEGEFVGDSITRSFTSGQFDDSRSASCEFPATSGFTEESEFNAYRVGGERWTVEILEGPSADASGREFKSLFTAPISSLRR